MKLRHKRTTVSSPYVHERRSLRVWRMAGLGRQQRDLSRRAGLHNFDEACTYIVNDRRSRLRDLKLTSVHQGPDRLWNIGQSVLTLSCRLGNYTVLFSSSSMYNVNTKMNREDMPHNCVLFFSCVAPSAERLCQFWLLLHSVYYVTRR